jgi:hypothetical protein
MVLPRGGRWANVAPGAICFQERKTAGVRINRLHRKYSGRLAVRQRKQLASRRPFAPIYYAIVSRNCPEAKPNGEGLKGRRAHKKSNASIGLRQSADDRSALTALFESG